MEYRARRPLHTIVSMLLYGVVWIGVLNIAWNLFKPRGWLSWLVDFIRDNQPTSFYYLGLAILGVFAGKYLLDSIGPDAFRIAMTMLCAFVGTFFILSLFLPV